MDFSTILIKLRSIKGYSQEAVAEEIGVNYKTYARYEAGKTEMKVSTMQALADFYGLTLDELIDYDPENPATQKRKRYDEHIQEMDHKLELMEQQHRYLTRELQILKQLDETKQKYVNLLEQQIRDKGGGESGQEAKRAV